VIRPPPSPPPPSPLTYMESFLLGAGYLKPVSLSLSLDNVWQSGPPQQHLSQANFDSRLVIVVHTASCRGPRTGHRRRQGWHLFTGKLSGSCLTAPVPHLTIILCAKTTPDHMPDPPSPVARVQVEQFQPLVLCNRCPGCDNVRLHHSVYRFLPGGFNVNYLAWNVAQDTPDVASLLEYSRTLIIGTVSGCRKPISGSFSVWSGSFRRQNVQHLAGLSCKRELFAYFSLPLLDSTVN
jgi:hypothetical protein